MPEKDINWDKLLHQLEEGAEATPLSAGETEIVQLSGAIHPFLRKQRRKSRSFRWRKGGSGFNVPCRPQSDLVINRC